MCTDSRTLQSKLESVRMLATTAPSAKVHISVDALGHLMALKVISACEGDREQVAALAEEVQQVRVVVNDVMLALHR